MYWCYVRNMAGAVIYVQYELAANDIIVVLYDNQRIGYSANYFYENIFVRM